jgi:hypothetical protein
MLTNEYIRRGTDMTGDQTDKAAQKKNLKLEGHVEHREHAATSLAQSPDAIDIRNADRATLRFAS